MALTYFGFYLGSGSLIDPTEGNTLAESAGNLVGQSYGASGNPLADHVVTITSQNAGGVATALDQNNNAANDGFSVSDGSTTTNYTFDAAAQYGVTITYVDGSTAAVTGIVFQATDGSLFLAPGITAGGAYNAALEAGAITSVTINSLIAANFSGLATDRAVLNIPTCFVTGTAIATARGWRPVEALRPGDLVLTADAGLQPLRALDRRAVAAGAAAANPGLRAVRMAPGSLGPGLPQRPLRVSQQHRMFAAGPVLQRATGLPEALMAARHLVGLPGIAPDPSDGGFAYLHLVFDRHHLVQAEGVWTESLYLGDQALRRFDAPSRAVLTAGGAPPPPPARPILTGRQAGALVRRLARNGRPLDARPPGILRDRRAAG
jgi:hypothetical protein